MKKLFYLLSILLSLFIILNSCSNSGTESTPIYQLETVAEPSQAGAVSPSSGEFDEGETAEISASANEGWIFEKWQGGHTGTSNPASVTMNQDKQVTALFVKIEHALNKEVQGEGDIYERIIQAKTTTHEPGTVVEVIAVPDEGWKFSHWETDIDGSENPVTLTMDGEKTVTAVFERRDYELSIEVEGEGAVAEEEIQAKTTEYPYETLVELTANPAIGWEFDRWEGDLQGNENPAQIEITDAKQVKAVFVRQIFEVNTTVEGEGVINRELVSGTETETGYEYESVVQLMADPEVGWEFAGWTGDIESTENPISVTVDTTKEITALFERIEYTVEVLTDGEGTVSLEQLSGEEAANGYYYGTEIELTATSAEEWIFVNWEGDTTSEVNPLTLTIEDNVSLSAIFALDEYNIDINLDGEGEVVTELLSGEQTETGYKYGAEVRVSVNPTNGWNFVYWDGDLSGTDNPIDIIMDQDYSATAFLDESPFVGGNGSELYPYQISSVEQLQEMGSYTDKHFVQINDIDASITSTWNSGKGFKPIGDDFVKFKGSFDGNNYSITDLNIVRPSEDYIGLFGVTDGSTFKNINLTNVNIEGSRNVGVLVGYFSSQESVLNITTSGYIKGSSSVGGIIGESSRVRLNNSNSSVNVEGYGETGGLIGRSSRGDILEEVYFTGSVKGSSKVGGLIGYGYQITVKRSYATGNVFGSESVGGIIGDNYTNSKSYGDGVLHSFSTGKVTGTTNVGGLVGRNARSNIENSFSTSQIEGDERVGGLVGLNETEGHIISTYSVGNVTGNTDVGGLIGINGATVESSYWNTESSSQSGGVGRGPSDSVSGLISYEMTGSLAQENMPEFDWINIWITTDSYPILRWQQE